MAAVQTLLRLGSIVTVQDSKPKEKIEESMVNFFETNGIICHFGEVPAEDEIFDLLVLSPGVPPDLEFIQKAKEKGAEIIGELELAYRLGNGTYIAITGTNGKTTTTSLVGEIFKLSGRITYVVGNIGVPVVSVAVSAEPESWLVTEVSSFQLETTKTFKPKVSALLNLTPDHLNRHKDMQGYGSAKAKVFANQDDTEYFIVNYDDKEALKWASECKARVVPFSRKEELVFGAFVKDGMIVIKNEAGELVSFCEAEELQIPGSHNLENALAAAAVCYFAGVEETAIAEGLRSFRGVEHRIEFCGEVGGVRFVNDSKGTNPDAAIKAIEAMKTDVILIAGGYDKGSTFDEFVGAFGEKVKHLLLLGKTAPYIKETAEKLGYKNVEILKDMKECVSRAYELAKPGDTVLLSPACASWDMYSCFEERGQDFKDCMAGLEE